MNLDYLKRFFRAIFLGDTRTHVSTREHREFLSDINVSKQLHDNMFNNKKEFTLTNGIKTYNVKVIQRNIIKVLKNKTNVK